MMLFASRAWAYEIYEDSSTGKYFELIERSSITHAGFISRSDGTVGEWLHGNSWSVKDCNIYCEKNVWTEKHFLREEWTECAQWKFKEVPREDEPGTICLNCPPTKWVKDGCELELVGLEGNQIRWRKVRK